MFTSISLSNFKGHKSTTLNLKKINILIGKNGTGKSSIIHALSVIKASMNQTNNIVLKLPYIHLGDLEDIVSNDKECTINISGRTDIPHKYLQFDSNIDYSNEIKFNKSGLMYHKTETLISKDMSIKCKKEFGETEMVSPKKMKLTSVFTANILIPETIGQLYRIGNLDSQSYTNEEEIKGLNSKHELDQISKIALEDLSNYYVIPVTRGLLQKRFALSSEVIEEPPISDLNAVAEYFINVLTFDKRVRKEMSDISKKLTGIEFDLQLVKDSGFKQEPFNPIKNTKIVNEGFGSNQVLYLLFLLLSAKSGSTLGIEEPEVHLHPLAQWDLAHLICEKSVKENKQIIMTTHSEHIIYAILSKVTKGDLKVEDVAIYNFDTKPEFEYTNVTELKIEQDGRIAGGLKGFVDATLRALDEQISQK